MKKSDVSKLAPGIYRLFWKGGGTSLAAVGITANGERWMAPTNWISPSIDHGKCWRLVDSAELVLRKLDT